MSQVTLRSNVDTIETFLRASGLDHYLGNFQQAGLVKLSDIHDITNEKLWKLGMTATADRETFFQKLESRKQGVGLHPSNLGVLEEEETLFDVQDESNDMHPGEGIVCEVETINLKGKLLSKEEIRRVYVKMFVCETENEKAVPLEETVVRTRAVPGFETFFYRERHQIVTNFSEMTFFVVEVKLKKKVGSSRLGIVFFPARYFLTFKPMTVVDAWFPFYEMRGAQRGPRTGEIHMRLSVPGGVPSQVGNAYHVSGVIMELRKLVVVIFCAKLRIASEDETLPSTCVKIALDNNNDVWGRTQVVKQNAFPYWNEEFEFFTELEQTKCLIIKLKEAPKKIGNSKTLASVTIPLQFYLAQTHPEPVNKWFDLFDDDSGTCVGEIHLALDVVQREESEINKINHGRSLSICHRHNTMRGNTFRGDSRTAKSGVEYDITRTVSLDPIKFGNTMNGAKSLRGQSMQMSTLRKKLSRLSSAKKMGSNETFRRGPLPNQVYSRELKNTEANVLNEQSLRRSVDVPCEEKQFTNDPIRDYIISPSHQLGENCDFDDLCQNQSEVLEDSCDDL